MKLLVKGIQSIFHKKIMYSYIFQLSYYVHESNQRSHINLQIKAHIIEKHVTKDNSLQINK